VSQHFIESPDFPVDAVNKASAEEKRGGGRPDYWEMVFWWTRKPLASARAVVAGAALPSNIDPMRFKTWLRLDASKTPHRLNPEIPRELQGLLKEKKLLDPFAGFGSIPLEAMRLGIGEVVAVELLPVAYVFLKAILEIPKWSTEKGIANELVKDVERWGKWIAEELRKDPDIRELYDEDVAVYIGTWEVQCPICKRYTPLVGNWWLARVKKNNKAYTRLAWMKPVVDQNEAHIEVVDLNRIHGATTNAKVATSEKSIGEAKIESYMIRIAGKEYSVPEPNVIAEAEYARCLLCNNVMLDEEAIAELKRRVEAELAKTTRIPVRFSDMFYRQLFTKGVNKSLDELKERAEKGVVDQDVRMYTLLKESRTISSAKEVLSKVLKELGEQYPVFYPKKALRDWNKKLEEYLNGLITLEELKTASARPRLLVKVKVVNKQLVFEPATREDNEKLWKALEKLRAIWGDPDIPKEPIAPYGNRYIFPILYGFDKWYKLFNPRQLLVLVKLVKLVREAGKRVEKEKLDQGWSKEDARKYAEAVTTYLAIVLSKHVDWNSMMSGWQLSYLIAAHTLAMRGIAMVWNWGEYSPYSSYRGTLSAMLNTIVNSLEYLHLTLLKSVGNAKVILDDATELSKLEGEKFDVIVTDPPYRDDVPYAELSDFYYVWLKRALSDVVKEESGLLKLAPRFYMDAFFVNCREVEANCREIEVQWKEFSTKEVSYEEGRARSFGLGSALDHYRYLMASAFNTMNRLLKDDGLLITYFAHTDPEAWAELIEAGWKHGGFTVTAGFPVATESAQSVIKQGKLSLDTSIVVVWRKGAREGREASMDSVVKEMFSEGVEWSKKVYGKLYGRDLFFSVFTRMLSVATRYGKLYDSKGEVDARRLVEEYVTPLTVKALVTAISGEREGEVILDKAALFYLITKLLYATSGVQVKSKTLTPGDIVLLSLATGLDSKELLVNKILVKTRKKDEYRFMEPLPRGLEPLYSDRKGFIEFLESRGLDPVTLSVNKEEEKEGRRMVSVDVLHLMEYAVTTDKPQELIKTLKKKYPELYDSAVKLARLLVKALPKDPESIMCNNLFLYLDRGEA
jgi:putative DNA methylase